MLALLGFSAIPMAARSLEPAPPSFCLEHEAYLQFEAVTAALAKGDAEAVSRHFDQTVELALPGLEDIFPKASAAAKLKGFFNLNPASGFTRVHGGTSRGEVGAYVIGTLNCSTGKFRVYLYGRGDGQILVQELRIERE